MTRRERLDERRARLSAARRELLDRQLLGLRAEPTTIARCRASTAPLAWEQRRLWVLGRLFPNNPAYNVTVAVRLRGRLDALALERAFEAIVRRQVALRTSLVSGSDGEPEQRVLDDRMVPWADVDLSMLPAADRERLLVELVESDARSPFDLSDGPLCRASLFALAPDDHAWIVTLHHLIADGASTDILTAEVAEMYQSLVERRPPVLPPITVEYRDFAAHQREPALATQIEEHVGWWARTLAGAPDLDLSKWTLGVDALSISGAARRDAISGETKRAIEAIGIEEGATPFMTYVAAFFLLLFRETQQPDISIGVPVSHRTLSELEPLIGCFANTLVIRSRIAGAWSFRELVRRIASQTVEALAHDAAPFERVVDRLQPPRLFGRTPLFSAMFAFQDRRPAPPEFRGLSVERIDVANGTAKVDLLFSLHRRTDDIAIEIEHRTQAIDAARAERIAEHWQNLLAAIVRDPERRIDALEILSERERALVVPRALASRGREPPSICEAFERAAARAPSAIALSFEGETISYSALVDRVHALRADLQSRGIGREDRVGIAIDRSIELVVALLGVLEAGAAFVAFDTDHPRARIASLAEDAGVKCMLTAHEVNEVGTRSVDHDPAEVSPLQAAYLMYTSGSTGEPRAIVGTHGGLANKLAWMIETHPLEVGEGVLFKTSVGFDVSIWEWAWPLMCGARVVIARPGGQRDTAYLARLIERESVTTAHFVPSMLEAFLREPEIFRAHGLRRVFASGEALHPECVERFFARLEAELWNQYGPTEASIEVTSHRCLPSARKTRVSIGRAIEGVRLYVLDDALMPAPIGCAGELYIAGIAVARGYDRRGDWTAERFVPDPYGGAGARMYRTGDRCRVLDDGGIEYLERIDDQVKIRGQRVEPGEIARILRGHERIADAVVGAKKHGADARLVAHVLPSRPEDVPSAAELKLFLRARLPEFMIPGAFVFVREWPVTPSGKLDRAALPPEPPDPIAPVHERPSSATERALAEIWRVLLGKEIASAEVGFFDVGGHSILLIHMHAAIRERFGADFEIGELFRRPTIRSIAAFVDGAPTAPRVGRGRQRGAARRIAMERFLARGAAPWKDPSA
jgi:amino acid adenylation domain-containing protein